jgi:hypothetical protein
MWEARRTRSRRRPTLLSPFSDPSLCLGPIYHPTIGNRYEAAFELGSGCGGRWQTAEKAAQKNLEAAEKKALPEKENAAKKKVAPKKHTAAKKKAAPKKK